MKLKLEMLIKNLTEFYCVAEKFDEHSIGVKAWRITIFHHKEGPNKLPKILHTPNNVSDKKC
jgi:hypothetical protein